MSASNAVPFSVYKAMICDMIHEETDERFIRQIYSIVRHHQKVSKVMPPDVGISKEVKE